MRIFGVIVIYHPPVDVAQNIHSYLPYLDRLLVIDNTQPNEFQQLKAALPDAKISWHGSTTNEGIAKPWNRAAEWALQADADWLLFMDQDSCFAPNGFADYIGKLIACNPLPGLLSPLHLTGRVHAKRERNETVNARFVMASGSLLNLNAYQQCGHFDEKLFLDLVDHEYCLRLRANGFRVQRVNSVPLHHRLGELFYLMGKPIAITHTPARYYYRARNRVLIMFKYLWFDPAYFLFESVSAAKDVLRIVLFESLKTQKFLFMGKGYWHALKGGFDTMTRF